MNISITRALAKIKSLDDRIAKATSAQFVSYAINKKSASGLPVEDVKTTLRGNLQSVMAMIAERAAIKAKVVASNAVATVVVAGVTMTVAQAIERKTSIAQEQALLNQLRAQYHAVSQKIETTNTGVQSRLDALIQTAVGKDRKVDEAEIAAIAGPFREQNTAQIIDPNNIVVSINALSSQIDNFLLEVDYALSEVNAITQIEIA